MKQWWISCLVNSIAIAATLAFLFWLALNDHWLSRYGYQNWLYVLTYLLLMFLLPAYVELRLLHHWFKLQLLHSVLFSLFIVIPGYFFLAAIFGGWDMCVNALISYKNIHLRASLDQPVDFAGTLLAALGFSLWLALIALFAKTTLYFFLVREQFSGARALWFTLAVFLISFVIYALIPLLTVVFALL